MIAFQDFDLTANQGDPVRLYKSGTVVSELIEAATAGGDDKTDEAVRNLRGRNAQQTSRRRSRQLF
jgi:hypothetical protein